MKTRLELEALRLQNAKLQQDLLSARGTAELADIAIEPQVLGQNALRKIADTIVSNVACKLSADVPTNTLMIHDKAAFEAMAKHRIAMLRLTALNDAYAAVVIAACAGNRPTQRPAMVGEIAAIAALIGLLKSDVKIQGAQVTAEEEALVSEIARALRRKPSGKVADDGACQVPPTMELIYPKLYVPLVRSDSPIVANLTTASEWRARAMEIIADKSKDKGCVERLDGLNKEFDLVWADLFNVNATSGSSGVADALLGQAFESHLGEHGKILFVKIVAQGGNNKANSHVLWTTFSHSGGAVVSYMLLDRGKGVSWGETAHYYTGYMKASEIARCNFLDQEGVLRKSCSDGFQ